MAANENTSALLQLLKLGRAVEQDRAREAVYGTPEQPNFLGGLAQGLAESPGMFMSGVESLRDFGLGRERPRVGEFATQYLGDMAGFDVPDQGMPSVGRAIGRAAVPTVMSAPATLATGGLAGLGIMGAGAAGGAGAADVVRQSGGGGLAQFAADMGADMASSGLLGAAVAVPALALDAGEAGMRQMTRKPSLALRLLTGQEDIPAELTKATKKRITNLDVADYFKRNLDDPILDYAKATPRQIQRYEDDLLDETMHALSLHPEAAGWYKNNINLKDAIIQEMDPDYANPRNRFALKSMLAVTSQENKVSPQFDQSMKIYDEWKRTGRFNPEHASGKARSSIMKNIQKIQSLVDALGGEEQAGQWMMQRGTIKELREAAMRDLGFTKEEAMKLGSDFAVTDEVPFSAILGPKIGSFYANLNGDYSPITMDRWFMMTSGRLSGQLLSDMSDKLKLNNKALRAALDQLTPEQRKQVGITSKMSVAAAAKKLRPYMTKNWREAQKTPELDTLRKLMNQREKYEKPFVLAARNSSERNWIASRVNSVQDRLRQQGIELENADLQALLWYYEKELYAKLKGVNVSDLDEEDIVGNANDYAAAAEDYFRRVVGQPSGAYAEGTGRVGRVGRGTSGPGVGE